MSGLTEADQVVVVPLVVAVLLVLVTAAVARPKVKFSLWTRLGGAKWDIQDSWASNLTAVGAAVTAVLAISDAVFGERVATAHLSRAQYTGLSVFFGVLLLVAAFAFNGTRRARWIDTGADEREAQLQGFVLTFLIASILTLWAVLGQLALIFLFVDEMRIATALTATGAFVFRALDVLAVLLVLFYGWVSVRDTIQYHGDLPTNIGGIRFEPFDEATMDSNAVSAARNRTWTAWKEAKDKRRLREWSLL